MRFIVVSWSNLFSYDCDRVLEDRREAVRVVLRAYDDIPSSLQLVWQILSGPFQVRESSPENHLTSFRTTIREQYFLLLIVEDELRYQLQQLHKLRRDVETVSQAEIDADFEVLGSADLEAARNLVRRLLTRTAGLQKMISAEATLLKSALVHPIFASSNPMVGGLADLLNQALLQHPTSPYDQYGVVGSHEGTCHQACEVEALGWLDD